MKLQHELMKARSAAVRPDACAGMAALQWRVDDYIYMYIIKLISLWCVGPPINKMQHTIPVTVGALNAGEAHPDILAVEPPPVLGEDVLCDPSTPSRLFHSASLLST